MSASRNAEAVSNQPGQVGSHVPRDEPLTTKGHQAGRMVSEADHAPEFHAQTLPAGSAPSDRTFEPNVASEVPGQALNPDQESSTVTDASSTLGGATSQDVHTGLGHPGQGQSSSEMHHDGQHGRAKHTQGLTGVGARVPGMNQAADPRLDQNQRGLDEDEATPGRGDKGALGAEDLPPASAEEVASERR
ncbi:MAG: hypothetical protein M1819_006200 [Sarea resinae]|nr:MAG: hypothetical protein M1819_006200 [Sarea resinae]